MRIAVCSIGEGESQVIAESISAAKYFIVFDLFEKKILEKIANNYGSVRGISEVPEDMQKTFVTTMDIHWMDHVYAQSIWQDWISNAIAKTINMPADVTVEDVKNAYLLSHELGLKGVTVFRDGSRHEQVLHITGKNKVEKASTVKPSKSVISVVENLNNKIVKDSLLGNVENVKYEAPKPVENKMEDTTSSKCPSCKENLITTEGCHMCISCGFSACSSG